MSYDPSGQPEPTTTAGSGMKIFLVIAGLFMVCCLLCCGGVLVGGWWLGSKGAEVAKEFAERTVQTSNDPVEIKAYAEQIVQMEPPQGLQPEQYWEAANPFTDELIMSVTTYQDEATGTMLVIGEFGALFEGSTDPEQLRRELEKSLAEQGEQSLGEINPQDAQTLPATIHGEPASFVVLRGQAQAPPEGEPAAAEQVVVQGTFKTDRGTGFLLLQGPSEHLSDEEIKRFVESLE